MICVSFWGEMLLSLFLWVIPDPPYDGKNTPLEKYLMLKHFDFVRNFIFFGNEKKL